MQGLIDRRCYYHSRREAAARCLDCGRYFCRECVTEHADRVVCASCLRRLTKSETETGRIGLSGLFKFFQAGLGILVLWMSFYYFGQLLLSIPVSLHEGTLWQSEERGQR